VQLVFELLRRITPAIVFVTGDRRTARRRLSLEKHEHILGTLLLGHPAVKLRNKVEGKALPVRWV
jgi:hypothetical protein